MKPALKRKIFLLFIILVLSIVWGVINGSVNLSLAELLLKDNRQILYLRLARVLLAMVAGAGLAVSGVALQAILRNPLAEPYLLGTSSGAGLGSVIAIIIGIYSIYIPFAAFIGAVLSIILVYAIAKQGSKVTVQSIILSGVIVSIALSAIITFLLSVSGNEALQGLLWWLWGSLQVYNFKLLFIVSLIVLAGIIMIYMLAQDLNAISIGEEEAIHLGIKVQTLNKILILVTSLITASLVSICGIIGFVGLIIPHMMRNVFGANHKVLIPTTCILGAAFMVVCDTVSKIILPPLEIPIGVITAIIGAPIFIILLKRSQRIREL